MLDFTLTPEQLDLQQKAREFAQKEILPIAWYYDEIDETPMPLLKKAYDAGLINGDIPHQYGGMGWGLIESTGSPTAVLPITCPSSPPWIPIRSMKGCVLFWWNETGRGFPSAAKYPNWASAVPTQRASS